MTVWAFASIPNSARELVHDSIKKGKSRFGWGNNDEDNLRVTWNGKLGFLLEVKPKDWIVHVNLPKWGVCVAVQVVGEYEYDDGLKCDWGQDFRHAIPVDTETVVEFNRRDSNILPTVNLNPRQRYHRVRAEADFFKSLKNLENKAVQLNQSETREIYHLKDKTDETLKHLTKLIHQTHKGKELERFFAQVFRNIDNVVKVKENGFGYKTDNGADLIVTMQTSIANIEFEKKIVVQLKSFGGTHNDLTAVEQIVNAIKYYNADAGIIITTATKTEELEKKIQEQSHELVKPIDLLAGDDVAKFVIKHAKDLLFRLDISS
ncbi:MAG TPA: restriction endonuclease [Thiotrichaceae bacterium]|nr:restriction endonuclease [Thiotrichaceae bacterium]